MIKNILLVIVAFISGLLINKIVIPVNLTETKQDQCEELATAKNDLIMISQSEYIEYTKIKDLKQKYEKADELLGKVMLLFLADIGFKASKMTVSEMEFIKPEQPINESPIEETSNDESSSPLTPPTAVTVSPVSDDEGIKNKSVLIRNLKSRAQIIEALDKALIENPKVAVANASAVEQKQMKVIEGSFVGEIKFFDKKREDRNLSWMLVPNYREKPITTEFSLRMYGGGKGESEAAGKGELRHVSILAEDPFAFIVETCGGECYFQLYYNAIYDQFYGNYYESIKNSKKFERVGLVNLRR